VDNVIVAAARVLAAEGPIERLVRMIFGGGKKPA
jgi:hypothetical protein